MNLRPPAKTVSQSIGDLTHMYAYHFTPYIRTKFHLFILINKKLRPSAPRNGRFAALRGLTHTNAHYCILFCMNSMHTKFQLSISMNKKTFEMGGLRPPTKGRFAVHRRVNLYVFISFYSIYAYQISGFLVNPLKPISRVEHQLFGSAVY